VKASDARGTKIKDLTPEELAALNAEGFWRNRELQASIESLREAYAAVAALGIDPAELMESACPPPSPR
jgi:hypothetical protein